MSIYPICAALLATLLLAFSASQLGLGSYVLHYSSVHGPTNDPTFTYGLLNATPQFTFYYLPVVTPTRSYILQIATGALGVVIALVILVLSFRSKPYSFVISGKRAPRNIAWPGISIGLSLLVFLLALPTIVVTFFDNAHFGKQIMPASTICLFEHGNVGNVATNCGSSVNVYWPYTIEAWTCKLTGMWLGRGLRLGNEAREPVGRTCQISTLSRWWTIPLLVLPILIIIIALLEIRRKNIEEFELQRQQESHLYPKEQSFSSAENGSPASPVSPMSTLPQYSLNSELHNKAKVEAEMGGKQVVEAPEKLPYDEMPAQQHQIYNELSANRSNVAIGKS